MYDVNYFGVVAVNDEVMPHMVSCAIARAPMGTCSNQDVLVRCARGREERERRGGSGSKAGGALVEAHGSCLRGPQHPLS
jgi:hypothetical protein